MIPNSEALKNKLEAEKAELEKQLATVGRPNLTQPRDWEPKPEEGVDLQFNDEVADFLESSEEDQAMEIELEKRLREVNLALTKMQEGRYGLCEIGQEPIEADRLEANPAARTCKQHLGEDASLPEPR